MLGKEYTKKIKLYKRTKILSVLVGVLLFVGIIILWSNYISNRSYETTEIIKEIPMTNVTNSDWVKLGESILTYTTDGVNCISEQGVLRWNRAYQLQEPKIDVCGNIAAIGEYNGTCIYVVSEQSELGEIDTGMPIKDFSVSATGVVAAVLEDGSTTWINLFSAKGEELVNIKTTMQDSGYPIEIDVSENGLLLGVTYLYIQNTEVKSRVAFYNFGDVGQNKSDMLVSGYDYSNAVVPVVQFMDMDTSFAIGDNRLVIYDGKEIPLHKAETFLGYEVQGVVHSNNYIGLLRYNQDLDIRYKLSVYNESATVVSEIDFDIYYSEILLSDNRVVVYNENEFFVYRLNGQLIYREYTTELIQKILFTDKENRFIIVYKDAMQIIELR